MRRGVVADPRANAAQAVEPRGRERASEAEFLDQRGLGRDDFRRRAAVVEIAQQRHDAADERGFRVAAEPATAVARFAHQPDGGDAAAHAVVVDVLGARGGEARAGAIDDRGETFLRVLDEEEVGDHLLLSFGDGHGAVNVRGRGARGKARSKWGRRVSKDRGWPDRWRSPPRIARGLPALGRGALFGAVNIFVASWFWRGLRGHSVTFSLLFASFVLGLSISGGVKHLLAALGVHWLYVLILPVVFFTWMNAREPKWWPDEERRRTVARSLLFGSIVLAIVINQIRH